VGQGNRLNSNVFRNSYGHSVVLNPPVIMVLLSPSLTSNAIAQSTRTSQSSCYRGITLSEMELRRFPFL
jgi:hypothetical protein